MKKQIKSIIFIALFCFNCFNIKADGLKREDFNKLPGYVVEFDYDGYPKEREIARRYFDEIHKDDTVFANVDIKFLGIDLYDINDDGKQEIFAYINYGDRCPLAGCPFVILQQQENDIYTKIPFDQNGIGKPMCNGRIKILSNKILNYNDLFFYDKDGNYLYIEVWQGSHYDTKVEYLYKTSN